VVLTLSVLLQREQAHISSRKSTTHANTQYLQPVTTQVRPRHCNTCGVWGNNASENLKTVGGMVKRSRERSRGETTFLCHNKKNGGTSSKMDC
jgi:hypothetical protein